MPNRGQPRSTAVNRGEPRFGTSPPRKNKSGVRCKNCKSA